MHLYDNKNNKKIVCHFCNTEGHKSNACPNKPKYCKQCKTNSHKTEDCRKLKNKNRSDNAKVAAATSSASFNFMLNDTPEEKETAVGEEEVGELTTVEVLATDAENVIQ